ncbi:MAG: DUF58 domain-containing protein [Gammaproteobacteria bacterium]|nr:DUF58 domain-containing protein [Gammaproteobacteria bacterium]
MAPSLAATRNSRELALLGPYTDIESLLKLRHLASHVPLMVRQRARQSLSGGRRSRFRGRGMDFSEVRAYQPGDDARSIDWRVTARKGRPHTKVFIEERERPVLVSVDQRSSMFFGTRKRFKSVLAAEAAALISWAALAHGDRAGGLVFTRDDYVAMRPKRSHHTVAHFMREIDRMNHTLSRTTSHRGEIPLSNALVHLRRVTRPGSLIYLVSDFHDADDACEEQMTYFAHHCDLVCVFVHDPLERELPPADFYTVTDGVERQRIDTGDRRARMRYHDRFEARVEALSALTQRLNARFVMLSTDTDPVDVLSQTRY